MAKNTQTWLPYIWLLFWGFSNACPSARVFVVLFCYLPVFFILTYSFLWWVHFFGWVNSVAMTRLFKGAILNNYLNLCRPNVGKKTLSFRFSTGFFSSRCGYCKWKTTQNDVTSIQDGGAQVQTFSAYFPFSLHGNRFDKNEWYERTWLRIAFHLKTTRTKGGVPLWNCFRIILHPSFLPSNRATVRRLLSARMKKCSRLFCFHELSKSSNNRSSRHNRTLQTQPNLHVVTNNCHFC